MSTPPPIPRAKVPLNPDADMHIIIQGKRRTMASNREVLAGAQTARGDAGPEGPQGPKGDIGVAGPAGPAGAKGETGPQGPKGATGSAGVAGPAGQKGDAGAQGLQGLKGDAGPIGPQGVKGDTGAAGATGPAGTPRRVETYTGTSNASSVGTVTFNPAFATPPTVIPQQTWVGGQMVSPGVTSVTATGCTLAVMRSRATLLLTTGPFESAPNTAFSVVVIG